MIYIPLDTFFSLASRIAKESDISKKSELGFELANLEKLVHEGKAIVGHPQN